MLTLTKSAGCLTKELYSLSNVVVCEQEDIQESSEKKYLEPKRLSAEFLLLHCTKLQVCIDYLEITKS